MYHSIGSARRAESGFSLIELMAAVAIVGILSAIAMSSYQAQTTKSRRTVARSTLLDIAGREEKLFSVTNAYTAVPATLGYVSFPFTVNGGYYTVTVQVPDPNQVPTIPTTYIVTATAAGAQSGDTQCTTLSVNNLGAQSSTGSALATTCWGS
jgi:type IV pilus assembly protein PilE